mgnify:FL=1
MTTTKIIFTRYLYEKASVEIALNLALLDRNEEAALFWAYELFHSGFEEDVFKSLWLAYYYFYASSNFYLEQYFAKKTKELGYTSKLINIFICNLVIKPCTIDVFLIRPWENASSEHLSLEKNEKEAFDKLFSFLLLKEYTTFMQQLQQEFSQLLLKNKINMKSFMNTTDNFADEDIICLSRLFLCFMLKVKKQGKKIYVCPEYVDELLYETLVLTPSRFILGAMPKYSVFECRFVSLFRVNYEHDLRDAYYNRWEYYAWRSPIWKTRLQTHGAVINSETSTIHFDDDDHLESFYEEFGLEPDDQLKSITERRVSLEEDVMSVNIKDFIIQYNDFGFILRQNL